MQDLVEAVQVVPALHKFLLFGLFAVAMAVPQKHIVASFDGSEATPAMAALPSDGEQSVVCAATEAHRSRGTRIWGVMSGYEEVELKKVGVNVPPIKEGGGKRTR